MARFDVMRFKAGSFGWIEFRRSSDPREEPEPTYYVVDVLVML